MRIHDISQPLGTMTATWPGDRPVENDWSLRIDRGDAVNVAAVTTSVHAGTHVDGFLHVLAGAETAAEMPLDAYVGRCTVVDIAGAEVIDERAAAGVDLATVERILFRTRQTVNEQEFPDTYAAVDPAFARRLAEAGVRLVGTDSPSVDPVDSKMLDAHRALMAGRIAILENVVLSDVPPGEYTLVALPLRLVEADSSPVRAVLIEGGLPTGGPTGAPAGGPADESTGGPGADVARRPE